jgi:hypothetical protein
MPATRPDYGRPAGGAGSAGDAVARRTEDRHRGAHARRKNSSLARAPAYAPGRWRALTRHTTDGRIEMANNAAEPPIRPIALRRKNWLFAGPQSLTVSIPRQRPAVIGRIAQHPICLIDELLPWGMK